MISHPKICLLFIAAAAVKCQTNIVDLGYARYQGVFNTTSNITSFRGIRYAAPPTGTPAHHLT